MFHVVFGSFDNKGDDYSVHELLSSVFWIGSSNTESEILQQFIFHNDFQKKKKNEGEPHFSLDQ